MQICHTSFRDESGRLTGFEQDTDQSVTDDVVWAPKQIASELTSACRDVGKSNNQPVSQRPPHVVVRGSLLYNFAFGVPSVGSIKSRISPAASLI